MEFITTLIATITINLIIHILLINYLCKGIIENFEIQDKYNDLFDRNINNIYDIIKVLVKKIEKDK